MTDRERVKLLFGPYQAPPLKRGDRAHCLVRDCEVVITGWTDARIPWPQCRALDSPGPGSGLLVDEELAAPFGTRRPSQFATGGVRVGPLCLTGARDWACAGWTRRGAESRAGRSVMRAGTPSGRSTPLPPRRPAPPRRKRQWTEGEGELVRKLPGVEAARHAGRTLTAVYQRRATLKVLDRRR
jgi:hypothetical protein